MPSRGRSKRKKDPLKELRKKAVACGVNQMNATYASTKQELNDMIAAKLNSDIQRIEQGLTDEKRLQRVVSASELPPLQGPIVVVTGPPAGGKGTQCKLLAERYGLIHLGVGDMVRDHMDRGTDFGRMAGEYVSRGSFIPDDLVLNFMRDQLRRADVVRTGCILDGFPRTGEQARSIMQWLDLEKFVLFELPDEEIVSRALNRRMDPVTGKIYNLKTAPPPPEAAARLTSRANDASEQIVQGRIRKYKSELGSIEACVPAGKLLRIDARLSIEEVHQQVVAGLGLGPPTVPGCDTGAAAEQVDAGDWGDEAGDWGDDDGAAAASTEMDIRLAISPSMDVSGGGEANVSISIEVPDLTERAPADICCVVDISGSMNQMATYEDTETGAQKNDGMTYLDIVKHAVKAVVQTLSPNDRFSLVQFDNRADIVYNLTNMSEDKVAEALNAVDCLHTRGSTDIWQGLLAGMEALRMGDPTGSSSEARSRAVLILTDGCPNAGPKTSDAFLPEIRKYRDSHPGFSFQVNTFGFGYNLISDLLVDIAKEGNGTFGFCPDALIVGTVFVNTVANVLSTWNQNAKLHLTEAGAGEFSGQVLGGHSVSEADWGRVVSLGPLTLGQTHDIVVPMNIPAGSSKYLEVMLEYHKFDGTKVTVACDGIARTGSTKSLVTGLRSEAVSLGWEALDAVSHAPSTSQANKQCKVYKENMENMAAKIQNAPGAAADATGAALLTDVRGRIVKSLTGTDRFNRWGKHYLRAITRAHQVQLCTNFMDPGLQVYGGTLFRSLVQKGTDVFVGMGAPTATRAAQATSTNYSSSSAASSAPSGASYMDTSGG